VCNLGIDFARVESCLNRARALNKLILLTIVFRENEVR
jgi:hypothetical protein